MRLMIQDLRLYLTSRRRHHSLLHHWLLEECLCDENGCEEQEVLTHLYVGRQVEDRLQDDLHDDEEEEEGRLLDSLHRLRSDAWQAGC